MKRLQMWACALIAVTAACESDGSGGAAARVEVLDSAGVRVVVLGSDLAGLTATTWVAAPVYQVGLEGSGVELFRVSGGGFLPNGDLVIGNSGVPEVIILGPTGEVVDRLGDRGEGPGQFGEITSVHPQPDGSVVVYDDGQGRLTSFSNAREVATRRMSDPSRISDLIPIAASWEGPVLAVLGDDRRFQSSGVRQDTTPLLGFSFESTVPDTLGRWATRSWSFVSIAGASTRGLLPFAPDLFTSGNSERVLIAESHKPVVRILGVDGGLATVIRWTESPREVTEDEYREWQGNREKELSERLPEELREAILSTPHYDSHAVLNGVLLGQDGTVWFAPSSLSTETAQIWLRFRVDGEPLPAVRLDHGVTVLAGMGDRVAVLVRNEMDVEIISVLDLGEG